jgi:DNA-binding MarR family transcriptional regulator
MLAVNLTGTFLCTQAALPDMLRAKHGRIVNIASTAGQKGYAYVSAYVAAKHGVIGLTRSLALEVATKGVTVNAVCPGYTETDILRDSIANVVAKTGRSEEEARAEFAAGNPQRRIVQPSEVADAVRWLCGDAAAAITGQSISVSSADHAKLKLWLRMLACTTQVEAEIRRRLRTRFGITLARFDYMAQLHRKRDGLKMRELSRYLMVTGGNVTGLTDDLERDGLVVREGSPTDRRAWIVRLTTKGQRSFEVMAREHEEWILELFAGLDDAAVKPLYGELGKLRVQMVNDRAAGGKA